ncbi:hypothetical protein C8R44DRAFT_709347 [Mycena epipterygia]|nr:hypothetical protein C8R44DRAFT_709347 [Mycena epipterygia]
MLLPLFCILVLAWTVSSSTVSLVIPIDEQLPLIARPNVFYSWAFSESTFRSTTGQVAYRTSSLPSWLSFDPSTKTFHGTPAAEDEGNPVITVTAQDSTSSVSSEFTMCVTRYPPPTLHIPLAAQFYAANPSLSSVFLLSPNSALTPPGDFPALRIPPRWSFSIGIDSDTYVAEHDLCYQVLQADGSALPDWMVFNQRSLTLNGVVPDDRILQSPYTVALVLHASDQGGYTAGMLPFNIVVAAHELCQPYPLPTINITDATPFSISLLSPDNFAGILVDGKGIEADNITSLSIDTSSFSWLKFDSGSRMLSGNPPSDFSAKNCFLPVTIETSLNQSLQTNVSLAMVPSYFCNPTLPPQIIGDDRNVDFNLIQDFSNATSDQSSDVKLSAAFDSPESGDCLSFDPATATLSGTIPEDFSASRIDITFTAYSNKTHSTSHTFLSLSVPSTSKSKKKTFSHPSNLSAAAHKKLVLAVAIIFGAIGGVCALGAFFSAFRRCAKVDDTAQADEEGRNVWSDSDKRWYGVVDEEKGYGFSMPRSAMDIQNPFGPGAELVTPVRTTQDYGALGLGLRRVTERSGSDPISNGSSPGGSQSPGVMRKGEFLTRIRHTVRNVSEKYGSRRKASSERPVISKPMLIVPNPRDLPFDAQGSPSPNPFDDSNVIRSYPGSTVMTNSPSTSTGEHSIPRRRADFAPPRSPALVRFQDGLVRQLSSGSLSSNEEAVVQIASKATSIRSGVSHHQNIESVGVRPRLVPFTSATRVPIPRVPSLSVEEPAGSPSRRVTSQKATVLKEPSDGVKRSPTADELSMGIHYVRSLGADRSDLRPDPSTPTVSTHVRSSFSSLESSHHGHAAAGGVMRTLVRTGEKFKFRVAVSLYSAASYQKVRKLEAKLMSGKPLPKFLHVDLNGNKHSGAVEFYGAPAARDLGEFNVGLYTVDDGACVGRVVVEVVGASR